MIKDFIKLFGELAYRHDRWRVWTDFLELAALSIANAFYRDDGQEQEYLDIIQRYEQREIDIFPKLLGCVVNGLEPDEGRYCDFLGTVFHELEMHNKYRGQFFTPYHLSKAIAKLQMNDLADREGIITVSEPSCGSGGMVIACCEVAKELGINYQRRMFFHAKDLDRRCFNMAYIQLTLIGAPALVELGDTLRATTERTYFTAGYFMAGMNYRRLFRREEEPAEAVAEEPATDPVEDFDINGGQLALFPV